MSLYRRLRWFAVAALLVQLTVGLGGLLTPRTEIFPFASWFLFSLVPGEVSDFDLVLHAAGGEPLEPPRRFSQSGRFVRTPHSIVVYQTIQQFGLAVERGDVSRAEQLRRQIESQFTTPGVRYDLVKATYDPVARWESDQTRTLRPLHTYAAGEF